MLKFDALYNPYPSQRMTVYANNGMVATSQPLAAQAGLKVLQQGGNAIDAAVATAAALTVVEPTSNGIGGDAFALVWHQDKLHGLNASGHAPQGLSVEAVRERGYDQMPTHGWLPVTVPGVPAAWATLTERFGNLDLTESLASAISYAKEGYPLSPVLRYYWKRAFGMYEKDLKDPEFVGWFETFAPQGQVPGIGDLWNSQGHAASLRSIAESKSASFYRGELAEKIDQFSRATGGLIRLEDLAEFEPLWVEPIKVNYRSYDIWEIPPNGQGLITLMALNILNQGPALEQNSAAAYHQQIEALKLAFTDGQEYITDHKEMAVTVEQLLSSEYGKQRSDLIGDIALRPAPGTPPQGGTVYLATADNQGNMVSYIQSNYMGFGSGVVVPGTGIALQNRGHGFSLDESHVNCLKPGKRTYHTIIPGFLTKDNQAVGPFGVMGGFMQPQGHLQVMVNTLDYHLNPQAALDAPRWQWMEDKIVELESSFPNHLAQALARKGHQVKIPVTNGGFGRGQIIWRLPNGVLAGGTESRTDGSIAAW